MTTISDKINQLVYAASLQGLPTAHATRNLYEIVSNLTDELSKVGNAVGVVSNSTSSVIIQKTAGVTLSGHRIVRIDVSNPDTVVYCDSMTLADAGTAFGMTLGAASIGAPVNVLVVGEVEEPSWAWTPGTRLYVGTSGAILTSPAGLVWAQRIGAAESATKVFLRFGELVIQG